MEDDIDDSGSDFDDDEDPDKIQVPGGGKDLAAAAGILESRENKVKIEDAGATSSNMMGKMNSGPYMASAAQMKMHQHPAMMNMGYDLMRNPGSKLD